jgi:flagellar protein FlaI
VGIKITLFKYVFKPKPKRPSIKALPSKIIRAYSDIQLIKGEIIAQYNIGPATVYVIHAGGEGKYIIQEPPVNDDILKAYTLIKEHIEHATMPESIVDPETFIQNEMETTAELLGIREIVDNYAQVIKYYLFRDIFSYGPIHVPMFDDQVEEVNVEGVNIPVSIVHRKISDFYWINTNIYFNDVDYLTAFVRRIGSKANIILSTAFPMGEGRSPEGHRITVSLSEVSGRGPSFTIRKFPRNPLTMAYLIANHTFSPLQAAYLWTLIENLASFLVIGAMASGKTTTLQTVLTLAPPDMKITTIEDVPELRLPHDHWDPLYTRHTYSLGMKGLEIGLFDLVKHSLRRRGQYIVVGEVRGEEAYNLVQSIATGSGGAATFHASDIESAIMRLWERPISISPAFMVLITSIIMMKRIKQPDGRFIRRATNIWEIIQDPHNILKKYNIQGVTLTLRSGEQVTYTEVFHWDATTDTFYPDTPEELIKISPRLKTIMEMTGKTEAELIQELKSKIEFLKQAAEDKLFEYQDFIKRVKEYYYKTRIIKEPQPIQQPTIQTNKENKGGDPDENKEEKQQKQ